MEMMKKSPAPGTRGHTKYPWHEWTDGQWREATQGVDFHCQASSFAAGAYVYGLTRPVTVECRTRRGSPKVQFRITPDR